MKKLLPVALLIYAMLFLQKNSKAQSIPVFPSVAVNPASPVFKVNDVSFMNADSAVAVGPNGMTWMSTDGGNNWSVISTFTSTANNNAVYWEDDYICIAGDQGTVTFSND